MIVKKMETEILSVLDFSPILQSHLHTTIYSIPPPVYSLDNSIQHLNVTCIPLKRIIVPPVYYVAPIP